LNILNLLNRTQELFEDDIANNREKISSKIKDGRFLVIGGAGSIGSQLVKELFLYDPKVLHVVDLSENGLVELVRQLRSTTGYGDGDFRALPLDVGSNIFDAFIATSGGYDYILNLSALKHVRSEKDPFTLMRLIEVNIFNAVKLARLANKYKASYFVISTDKAANPVNLMGASKRLMEKFLHITNFSRVTMSRFANVAFSEGSLLQSFKSRFNEFQPIVAPCDVERYFITPRESGRLCLLAALLGQNREIFVPKKNEELKLTRFSDIARRFIESMGYEVHFCRSEEEARKSMTVDISSKRWPLYLFESDTTGEKMYEEFYTSEEYVDEKKFKDVGVICFNQLNSHDQVRLFKFEDAIRGIVQSDSEWKKEDIVKIFIEALPELNYVDHGRYLDEKM
jgi:FlaA1/EpsC-like NDP-sugar epimerase